MPHTFLLLSSLFLIILLMTIFWLISLIQKKADIVDFGWSFCLGGSGIFYSLFATGDPNRRILLGIFTGFWGVRLCYHLLTDRVLKEEEDGRYINLRKLWGESANRKFYLFFLVQGFLALILSFPFLITAYNETPVSWVSVIIASLIFGISLTGESIADLQLRKFKSFPENRGKTCRVGLWNYSRHPNYFFEWIHWFSYVILAWGSVIWAGSLFNPIAMYYLITRVTGIPPTEERALQSRGDNYREYQKSTNAFFPWFKKNP